jgi:SOS response regulatory protein OraA/RecX
MVIDEALEEVEPDEIFRAEQLARSWLDSDISEEKILSRLARRGFTFRICREALNRACEESL